MELYIGIGIGVFYVVSLILAFMTGYGWDKTNNKEEE